MSSSRTYHECGVQIKASIGGHLALFSDIFNIHVVEKGGRSSFRSLGEEQEPQSTSHQKIPTIDLELGGVTTTGTGRKRGRIVREQREEKYGNAHDQSYGTVVAERMRMDSQKKMDASWTAVKVISFFLGWIFVMDLFDIALMCDVRCERDDRLQGVSEEQLGKEFIRGKTEVCGQWRR